MRAAGWLRAAPFIAASLLVAGCCPPAVSGPAPGGTSALDVPADTGRLVVPVQAQSLAERFEGAWRLVAERYWDLEGLPVDWEEVGQRYREQVDDLESEDALYDLLEEMYDEIGDNHSVYVRPSRVDEIRDTYGDLPCLAVFGIDASVPFGQTAIAVRFGPASMPGLTFAGFALGQSADSVDTVRLGVVSYGMTESGGEPVGYLRVPDLASDGVAGAVRQAVRRLDSRGAEALVMDLRGNPGGRLVTMMQVAGVFTRGFLWRAVLSWTLPMPYPAIGDPATDLPLFVLVDGGVNSAAEGLAGALQDSGRAVIVGEATAGNVEAVLPFCLRDGSQAWIATGVLAPLLGPTWEGRGVEPDEVTEPDEAFEEALRLVGEAR